MDDQCARVLNECVHHIHDVVAREHITRIYNANQTDVIPSNDDNSRPDMQQNVLYIWDGFSGHWTDKMIQYDS